MGEREQEDELEAAAAIQEVDSSVLGQTRAVGMQGGGAAVEFILEPARLASECGGREKRRLKENLKAILGAIV